MNYLRNILWIWFLLKVIDASYRITRNKSCQSEPLPNGRIRYANFGRRLTFYCNLGYERIGNLHIRCNNGQWDGPPPICASRDCKEFPLLHGKVTFSYRGSIAEVACDSDFNLIGSPFMYCDTWGWNDTIPECQAKSIHQFDICTFESGNTRQCNWIIKPMVFNWVVIPLGSDHSLYIPNNKLPPYDHTLGPQQNTGHVLYLEPMFLPSTVAGRLITMNKISAQYISPLFPAFEEMTELHCLIFYLYAKDYSNVTLEIFVSDEMIWSADDNLVSKWVEIKINLPFQFHSFRITMEGKAAKLKEFSGIAIDDLKIASGLECKKQIEVSNLKPITTSTTIQSTVSTTSEISYSTTSTESYSTTSTESYSTTSTDSYSTTSTESYFTTSVVTDITYEISPTTNATSSASTSRENNSYFINIGLNQNDSNHLSGESIIVTDKNILDKMQHITNDSEYNYSDEKRYREKEINHILSTYFHNETKTPTYTINSSSIAEAYENSSTITNNTSIQRTTVTSETSRPVIRNNNISQFKKPFGEKIQSNESIDRSAINSKYFDSKNPTPSTSNISHFLRNENHETYYQYNYKTAKIDHNPVSKGDSDFLVKKATPDDNLLQILVWGVSVGCILLLAVLLIALSARKYYLSNSTFSNCEDESKEFYSTNDIELDFKDKS